MKIIEGNIFNSKCQTLVNTVNCVGVMGAGIAFEMRLRYPEMFQRYKELCDLKIFNIGKLWLYKSDVNHWILNFPTKRDWKYPSKIEYIEKGLQKFIESYKKHKINSIAFPLLGASHGKLKEGQVIELMRQYLSSIDIPVEVYLYSKNSKDDLYQNFSNLLLKDNVNNISKSTDIKKNYIEKLVVSVKKEEYNSISSLLNVPGIGEKTIEKIFYYLIINKEKIESKDLNFKHQQLELF